MIRPNKKTQRILLIWGGALFFATIVGLFVDQRELSSVGVIVIGLACWIASWTLVRHLVDRRSRN